MILPFPLPTIGCRDPVIQGLSNSGPGPNGSLDEIRGLIQGLRNQGQGLAVVKTEFRA